MDTNKITIQIENVFSGLIYLHEKFNKNTTIKELAETIQQVTGHQGEIKWDTEKPDGTPRKLMDVSKMATLGWEYSTELKEGIEKTYSWFLENIGSIKEVKM